MQIYERIKYLRTKNDLTAEAVAKAIGVSRATVYRYETKEIENMPITILEPLSKILHCSPAYLMGWEDEVTSDQRSGLQLSELEKEVIHRFRQLGDGERSMFLRSIGIEEKKDSENIRTG